MTIIEYLIYTFFRAKKIEEEEMIYLIKKARLEDKTYKPGCWTPWGWYMNKHEKRLYKKCYPLSLTNYQFKYLDPKLTQNIISEEDK